MTATMKKHRNLITAAAVFLLTLTGFAQQAGWKSVGPVQFPTNVSGQINGIGRITQIKFHPTDPNVMYATSASGGLYRSDNLGESWQVLGTDSMPQTQLASVCIDHTDDQVLYIGTGDPNYYFTTYGVWKSTDGGIHWNQSTNGLGNKMAIELIMDPTDHNVIVAATNNGIFKTYNGGLDWQEKLSGSSFTDMKMNPGNDSVFYAVTRSQFFRSADKGETWTEITNGIAVPGGGDGGGMRLAVSAADPNVVYAGMIRDEGTIFRSDDAGLSFGNVYHNPAQSLVGYDAESSGQGNYNFGMCADPTDANTVYVVAHVVWKSVNGGVDWSKLTDWWLVVHTDMHGMAFSPFQTNKMFNINDGGIWLSEDGGANWSIKSDGLEATEAVHGACSPTQHDIVSIGTQDNGELYHSDAGWFTNRGGDWYSAMSFDCTARGYVYYHEQLTRRNPVTGGDQPCGLPSDQAGNNLRMAFTRSQPDLAFAGTTGLYRTTNLSDAQPEWELIHDVGFQVKDIQIHQRNPNIMAVIMLNVKMYKTYDALAGTPTFTEIALPAATANGASLAMDVHNDSIMYVALGSKVYRSYDNGAHWENITGSLPPVNIIRLIMDSARTDESVYIATAAGVYYRNTSMSDWKSFSHGLPTIASIQDFMIYDDASIGRRLRVAYYGRGIFETGLFNENTCAPPADITVAVDGIAAAVSWTGADSASLQYRNVSEAQWTTVPVNGNSALLRWLEHCQTYEVRMAGVCGTERGFYSLPVEFEVEGKQLSSEWKVGNIGGNVFTGHYCFNPAKQEISITSAGRDVWEDSDQLYYISQPVEGDAEIIARMTQVGRTDGWAKAGLMIREFRSAVSAHAMMCFTPDNGAAFQWRSATAGFTGNTNISQIGMPYWVRLVRDGDQFTGYISADSSNWTIVETATITMADKVQIGVFSCSHREDMPNTAVMDHVSLFPRVVGVEEPALIPAKLEVFPNPTANNLQLRSSEAMVSVAISDLNGNLLRSQNMAGTRQTGLQLSELPAGVYMLEVVTQNGAVTVRKVEKL